MSETYAYYLDRLDEYRAADSARYHLHAERQALRMAAKEAIAACGAPKGGLLAFAPSRLMVEGATYVEIDLSHNDARWNRVVLTRRITLRRNEAGDLRAVDDGGRDHGAASPKAFAMRPDYGTDDTWHGMHFGCSSTFDRTILPLEDVAIGDHPAGLRMLAMGRLVHDTLLAAMGAPFELETLAAVEDLIAHDGATHDELVAMDYAQANAKGRIEANAQDLGFDPERDVAADLRRDISQMDWTHDYADRGIDSARRMEGRIKGALVTMPLDHALAAMAAFGSGWFTYARQYLARHPGVKQVEDARRAAVAAQEKALRGRRLAA